jgi:hypothetical protein
MAKGRNAGLQPAARSHIRDQSNEALERGAQQPSAHDAVELSEADRSAETAADCKSALQGQGPEAFQAGEKKASLDASVLFTN